MTRSVLGPTRDGARARPHPDRSRLQSVAASWTERDQRDLCGSLPAPGLTILQLFELHSQATSEQGDASSSRRPLNFRVPAVWIPGPQTHAPSGLASSIGRGSARPSRSFEGRYAPQSGHSILRSRPVPTHGLPSGSSNHRTEDGRHDDRVVGVANDRDEVGHQVDGDGQVDEKKPKANPNLAGQAGVGCEASEKPYRVGKDPEGLPEHRPSRAGHEDEGDQRKPSKRESDPDRDQTSPDRPVLTSTRCVYRLPLAAHEPMRATGLSSAGTSCPDPSRNCRRGGSQSSASFRSTDQPQLVQQYPANSRLLSDIVNLRHGASS